MNIEDYQYETKELNTNIWEIFVIKKDGTKFSAKIISRAGKPPNEHIFNLFVANNKEFFLELEEIKENKHTTDTLQEKNLTTTENTIII